METQEEEATRLIKKSIVHWTRMKMFTVADIQSRSVEYPTGEHCPLCLRYVCEECPVTKRTQGIEGCSDTPYTEAFRYWKFVRDDTTEYGVTPDSSGHREMFRLWRECAQKEIDFLKSLLQSESEVVEAIIIDVEDNEPEGVMVPRGVLNSILVELDCRVLGLKELWPGDVTTATLYNTESLVSRLRDLLK